MAFLHSLHVNFLKEIEGNFILELVGDVNLGSEYTGVDGQLVLGVLLRIGILLNLVLLGNLLVNLVLLLVPCVLVGGLEILRVNFHV